MSWKERFGHDELPVLRAEGSHYDVGLHIGTHFRKCMRKTCEDSSVLRNTLLPYYLSAEGRAAVDGWLATSRRVFPHYVQELQGYADGSAVDFIQLFLLHVETEICTILDLLPRVSEGCSDLYFINDQESQWIHTEDEDHEIKDNGYLVDLHITREEGDITVHEDFMAYANPGKLPGNALGMNKHGLCVSVNVLFQTKEGISLNGIPRRMLNRATLPAASLPDVIAINSQSPGVASGCNYNIGLTGFADGAVKMHFLEIAACDTGTSYSVKAIKGFGHHFNNYLRLGVDQVHDPSSIHRERRLQELNKSAWTMPDVLTLVGDRNDADFPFYRDGTDPDYLVTAVTVLFDLKKRRLSIYRGVRITDPGSAPSFVCDIPSAE